MKKVKYILFLFLIYFSASIVVKADTVCVYKTKDNFKVTCNYNGSNVDCTVTDSSNHKVIYSNDQNFVNADNFKNGCPTLIYVAKETIVNNGIHSSVVLGITDNFQKGIFKNVNGENKNCGNICDTAAFVNLNSDNSNSYIGKSCIYKNNANNLAFTCTAAGENKINCTKTDNNSTYIYKTFSNKFEMSTFMNKNGECLLDHIAYEGSAFDGGINILNLYYPGNNCDPSTCLTLNGAKTNTTPDAVGKDQPNDFNADAFCQIKGVKGTFRTIGWVIVAIKILVPIILMIFGIIDIAKAITASKDDEIKKSIQSIVKRLVAGVIIFFIPTLLDFAIGLIGGDEVYDESSGTFGYCTHCMLKPTDDSCGSLAGGN